MVTSLRQLRVQAITHTLFRPTSLAAATRRLGFVQADPIRAPARAQDLILRQRVAGYRAGDLERRFQSLDLEEGILYAYGFLSRPVWQVAYPRSTSRLSRLEQEVLATVQGEGPMHPRALEAHFGRQRVVNAWGGWSKATTRALEHLQRRGLLRVARRDSGIRVYEAAPAPSSPVAAPDRFRKLTLVVAGILAPVTERGLLAIMAHLRRGVPAFGDSRGLLRDLLATGVMEREVVDGVPYLWPAIRRRAREAPPVVRFLAPFDPLVWERRRFEQLWGWSYRFEAYTPVQRRVRGYYALPVLWGEEIIGWANATVAAGRLKVELGFAGKRPRDRAFAREAEAETARLAAFLGVSRARAQRGNPAVATTTPGDHPE
jgi:uncharacterized protein